EGPLGRWYLERRLPAAMINQKRTVNILDLQPEIESLMPELKERFEALLRSGAFILGPETQSFEKEAAAYLGVKHAVGLNSGTDALIIALRTLGIGPGDEVITSPFSFFATAESIALVGATPVFVDVDLESMNIDPNLLEAAVTDRTKAIMPVHLFGRPAAMTRIRSIAQKHGLAVIEDAAQSFGARYSPACAECRGVCDLVGRESLAGRQTGSLGTVGCFSFYPTKNLGAYGDGGLLTTDDDRIAEMAVSLRNHGSIQRYRNEHLGYNSRLDAMQAMILRLKLPLIDGYNTARRAVATRYNERLAGVAGLILPAVTPGHIFHQYTVRITEKSRDEVAARLKSEFGVGSMVYYPIPQNRLPVFEGRFPDFANSDILADQVLSLPIHPHLSESDADYVADALKAVLAG
ncbi:MAG: DegT/DnrJ/EryC1/StrS family aminotransferase, partial [Fimbriimonadaceae bacterium]|nr:DegT/DnrJ/EryC1/StrS family aminotransferase [Fimbriimonadaceae bacterium]